jgi:hypothetical protein
VARHTIEVHTYNTTAVDIQKLAEFLDAAANRFLKDLWNNQGLNEDHALCPTAWIGSKILERGE